MASNEPSITDCALPAGMGIFELQAYIEATEKDSSLYEERNFDERMEVLDFIEFQVIDQIEELLQKAAQPDKLILLKHRAEKIKARLEEINITLFQRLQTNLWTKRYRGIEFKNLIHEYFHFNSECKDGLEEIGYDYLDIFINGLFSFQAMPEQTKDLEPEMVFYQKTPARIIFELAEKTHFRKEDVFFDIGAGLGQVAILVNILAGITAKGIEFEPAFCAYARDCARELNLSDVSFINIDARNADYSEGTIFFMYTPFKGDILQEVLALLRKEALQRKITIITYGPCTAQVALQSWLEFAHPKDDNIYKVGVFSSL